MRTAFAHYASLQLAAGGDDAAPGAAITVALCGHWEHEGPCPLAPHHTGTARFGDDLRVRTLFAVEPELENEVRQLIEAALANGRLVGPDGITTSWRLISSARGGVLDEDVHHAARLTQN